MLQQQLTFNFNDRLIIAPRTLSDMVLAPVMDFFPPLFILSVSIFIHFLNVGGGGAAVKPKAPGRVDFWMKASLCCFMPAVRVMLYPKKQ
ncbi:hypothetical protein OUZ56_007652 [Daphnia magna]|uniref:Uncharacterized protein n=1 Tax=Daphnia magna TaxID=35525 RepID=A0ABR0AAM7_9CRUS|nr:hypothetical protein OUZ56_007652 [Daphnia magna]